MGVDPTSIKSIELYQFHHASQLGEVHDGTSRHVSPQ